MKRLLLPGFVFLCMHAGAQSNYDLLFNGSDQYVSIGQPIPNGSSYTKEAWVYTFTTAGPNNIISSLNTPLWLSSGRLVAGQGGNFSVVVDPGAFPANQWVYVAVTYDAATSTMCLYRNGALVATSTSTPAYSAENTWIGSHDGTKSYFNGYMDEVRIWDIALTQQQLKANMYKGPAADASGLVDYFTFNDGSGSTLTNATGGPNGTLENSPAWNASAVQYGANALNFDGSDDYAVIPDVISSDFTIEYLMRTTATGLSGTAWYNGSGIVDAEVPGSTNDFGTALVGSKLAFGIGQSGLDRTIFSTSDVNTGNWVHVAATWKQSTGEMQLYINGTLESTGTGSTNLRDAPTRITLGELQTDNNHYNGDIDEVRIWNEVRTQAQIQTSMNSEIDPSIENTLAAYYTMDEGISDGSNAGLQTITDMKNTNDGTLYNFALSGTTSNFIPQSGSLYPLPLSWLDFTAQAIGRKARLQWSTAAEQNTSIFAIQSSRDGKAWTTIGTLPAAGNSSTVRRYAYTDEDPGAGLHYYRIDETDLDGKSSYSIIRIVNLAGTPNTLLILSNPVVGGTLLARLQSPCALSLFDSNGRLLWRREAASGTVSIDVSGYPKGIYFLKTGNETHQVLLQ